MPQLDKTGPAGQGPGTGFGRGNCAIGQRKRFGGCWGWGRRFWVNGGDQISLIQLQKDLEYQLEQIKNQIEQEKKGR